MRALVWHGRNDVRRETVPDAQIEHAHDAEDGCIKVVMRMHGQLAANRRGAQGAGN
jgi:hypothetical protein